jgi:hypothetical protein
MMKLQVLSLLSSALKSEFCCCSVEFVKWAIKVGEKILDANYIPMALQYMKRGSPPSLRPKLWKIALNSDLRDQVIHLSLKSLIASSALQILQTFIETKKEMGNCT